MRTPSGRLWRGALVTAAAVLTVVLAPARADASEASELLSLTNQVRGSSGLAPLTVDSQLTSVAQRWAATLAERGVISHNSSLPAQVTGWKLLGENVGVGATVDAVHAGWMASPTHHQNLVDPSFTKVGFGIVRPDARIFVVQVFMQPKSSATSVPAPSTSAPAPPTSAAVPPTTAPARATSAAASPASAGATPAPAVRSVPAASTAPATAVRAPTSPLAIGELSAWVVHNLDRLRSMEPAAAA